MYSIETRVSDFASFDRMVFVDRYTIRIMGEVIAHDEDGRVGYPIRSVYEKRKRGKGARSGGGQWAAELERIGLSTEEIEAKAEEATENIKKDEREVRKLRKDAAVLQAEQMKASSRLKRSDKAKRESGVEALPEFESEPGGSENEDDASEALPEFEPEPGGSENEDDASEDLYGALVVARGALRAKHSELIPQEVNLQRHRKERYYWNKLSKVSTSKRKSNKASKTQDTVPSWSWPMAEDSVKRLDISKLQKAQGQDKVIVFAGTDYGIRRMSETVPQTYNEIQAHINRFWVLHCKLTCQQAFCLVYCDLMPRN